MRPIRDLTRMVTTPLAAASVTGLFWVIDTLTMPQRAWWHRAWHDPRRLVEAAGGPLGRH